MTPNDCWPVQLTKLPASRVLLTVCFVVLSTFLMTWRLGLYDVAPTVLLHIGEEIPQTVGRS